MDISQGCDQLCTSYKIMAIPANSRRKHCTSHVLKPLDEIQVDTVPNPEPLCLLSESRYGCYLISCDRYSRIFRVCGIRDKTTDACIDGINLILSSLPFPSKTSTSLTLPTYVVILALNFVLTFSENGAVTMILILAQLPLSTRNKMA